MLKPLIIAWLVSTSGKKNTDNPKVHLSQKWDNANTLNIELMSSFNPNFHQMLSSVDINETWKLLVKGIENIFNLLAPTKILKHRSNFQPYIK